MLREEHWESLDIENLVEEIESLGRQERRELENRLEILLGHLLKWQFQPKMRSRSWFLTLREQRRKITRLLEKNPSLKPYLAEAVQEMYPDGRDLAMREADLADSCFPGECPYSIEQVLMPEFLPDTSEIERVDWFNR